MFYLVSHQTAYRYSAPICESQMEVRMRPRTEGRQRCWDFRLTTSPPSDVGSYVDAMGNTVHHFDVPGHHVRLKIMAESRIEIVESPSPPLPEALGEGAWRELDALAASGVHWDDLAPSHFARPGEALDALARELGVARRDDPLTALRSLNSAIHDAFAYAPNSTKVDSPIDDALRARRGVCQDFAHIMIALVRGLGIPCRYVSGYLFHRVDAPDRSAQDASHAWVEAQLPGLGWVGFDPTNDLIAADRHIRAAVGRDYADVPPTRGVFEGEARTETELSVGVRVAPSHAPPQNAETAPVVMSWVTPATIDPIQQEQQQQ